MPFGKKNETVKVNKFIPTSTGDIGRPYDIIDTTFALDADSDSGLLFTKGADPARAFDNVRNQLRENCRRMGGDAVIFCQFEYRIALNGNKRAVEIFAYGTVVKLR